MTNINLTVHTRSLLGPFYLQLLTDLGMTQLDKFTTLLRFTQAKDPIGKHIDKTAWATTLYGHPNILSAYKAGLQDTDEYTQDPQQPQRHPVATTTQDKCKGKEPMMPPMARETQEPLKQMKKKGSRGRNPRKRIKIES